MNPPSILVALAKVAPKIVMKAAVSGSDPFSASREYPGVRRVMVVPAVMVPVVASVRAGKAVAGSAALVLGQLTMNCEARVYTSLISNGVSNGDGYGLSLWTARR